MTGQNNEKTFVEYVSIFFEYLRVEGGFLLCSASLSFLSLLLFFFIEKFWDRSSFSQGEYSFFFLSLDRKGCRSQFGGRAARLLVISYL